ncbi:MAG: tRNA (N6-threonylcarbamoyladenosine(37)-N6)-methyltransferase TrmO [Desulfobacterales bacterium]|nr:tRNA (N6-threonylcarbamoyladenosine(37)-N6)-methyltransferase TrmO [Desulfobacterales bacterium]
MTPSPIALSPIGTVHSCFTDKFGVPRQPGIIAEARGHIELIPPYNRREAVNELESFSHLWVIFHFNRSDRDEWKPTVRPPRLGGNKRVGVFASRSNFRPNPMGLSVVRLEEVEEKEGRILIHISGLDLLDRTPVLDIKPYIPYVDAIPGATGGFAPESPAPRLCVTFSSQSEETLAKLCPKRYPNAQQLIEKVVAQDPRPAYYNQEKRDKPFGFCLWDLNIRCLVQNGIATVVEVSHGQ